MDSIKAEIANLIRGKSDDEIFAIISNLYQGGHGLVTKPVVSQAPRKPRVVTPKPRGAQVLHVPNGDASGMVYKAIDGMPGTTITTVTDMTRLPRAEVKKVIGILKEEGKVFQAGERRYTRYATSQSAAERASNLAQNAVKK
jgi:hypothetical protein